MRARCGKSLAPSCPPWIWQSHPKRKINGQPIEKSNKFSRRRTAPAKRRNGRFWLFFEVRARRSWRGAGLCDRPRLHMSTLLFASLTDMYGSIGLASPGGWKVQRPPQRKAVQKAPEGAPYLQPLLRCDGAGRILLRSSTKTSRRATAGTVQSYLRALRNGGRVLESTVAWLAARRCPSARATT